MAGEQSEPSIEPMISLIWECRNVEGRQHVLVCSVPTGFPHVDGEENGVHAVVIPGYRKNGRVK